MQGVSAKPTGIADEMKLAHYGLAHALLAALPVKETITTNYDELFERGTFSLRSTSLLLVNGGGHEWQFC